MIVSSTQAESGRQPLERQGATPRPNAPPPLDHTPRRNPAPRKAGLSRRPPESSPPVAGEFSSASKERASRLPADTSWSRAAVRRLAAGLLLVVAGLLGVSTAANAQTTLVSNTGQNNSGSRTIGTNDFAQAFGTGSHTTGYDLDSIVLSLGDAPTGTGTLTVTVRADASGDPSGTALYTLTNPDPFVANDLNTFPAPASATLDADSTYWVVASYNSTGGPNWWRVELIDGIDSGGATGWTIDSPYKVDSRTGQDGWEIGANTRGMKLQVKGTAKGGPTLSTDATLTNLALEDFNGDPITLNETFASTLLTYTASVTNADTQIDVLPTRSDANATIEYLDGDGVALPDADPDLTNFQVDLDPGDNVIQVKVTAEDTTTTKTYMVTVTREAATDTPVTIEAEYVSIGAGLEDLLFTLTREGETTDELEVTVTIAQAQSWLSNLEYTVTFPANSATAELTITASKFSFTPSTTGDLTATVSGDGIDGGSDTVKIISTSEPPITISYDMPAYTFAENATDAAVYLVATLDAAYPREPSRNYFVTFSTRFGTAKADEDYAPLSERETFTRSEYGRDADADPFVARKLLSDFGFAIVDDAIYEGSERLDLVIEPDPTHVAGMAAFQKPDGTTCEPFGDCPNPLQYPVTITDEGDLPALLLSVDPSSIAEEDDDGTTGVTENVSTVTVEITNGKTFAVDQTVTLTFSGTATQGTHYSVSPDDADTNEAGHQVVLPAGDSSVEVTVTATGNDTADGPRTVIVVADSDGTFIGEKNITILDDEDTNTDPTFDDGADTSRDFAETIGDETVATAGNIGTAIAATDTDTGNTLTYSLEGMDADRFEIVSTSGQLRTKVGEKYSYEAQTRYAVTVKVEDDALGSNTIDVTLNVTDQNEPPMKPDPPMVSATTGSTTSLDVSWTAPTNAGRPDITNYDLQYQKDMETDWTDGPENQTVPSASIGSLEAGTAYLVQVRATNAEGDSVWSNSGPGSTNTTATTPPAIVTGGVRATSMPLVGDTYGLGETIAITVTFDNAVAVDTSGGTPRIQFVLNGTGSPVLKWAEYSRGSGGTALVFTYVVQSGDKDDDGIWLRENELELQGGTISAAADNTVAAILTYARPGTQTEHKVNGSLTTTDATLSALALTGVTLAPTFVSSTETYTATVGNSVMQTTVTATPTHPGATVALKDGADNALTNPVTLAVGANVIKAVVTAEDTTTMKTYMVTVTRRGATTAPAIVTDGVQVTSTPMATANTYGRGETIAITVTFDNAVTVDTSGGTPRIAFHLDEGLHRWAEYSSGSGGTALVFTYTVQAGDRDADGIRLEGDFLKLQSGTILAAADNTNTVDATLTYAEAGLQSGHEVDGSLTTADATLSDLALEDNTGIAITLTPTFVSGTTSYTASAASRVSAITLTPTVNESNATVEYLNARDQAITDTDRTTLALNAPLVVGTNTFKVKVTAPDTTTMKTYMVTVTLAPAIVTNGVEVTSTPMATGDTYGRGETIAITVTFDNAVTVDTSGGTRTPRIAFHLDGGLRWAVYSPGSGDNTALVFTYTVLADDMAVNGILLAAGEVELFRGTIRAAADTTVDASLTYAEPGLQSGHKVDGSPTTTDEDDGTDDDDATLSSLALKDGDDSAITLSPRFAPATPRYTASVANRIDTVVLTATTNDSNAMVAITSDDDTRTPGEAELDLNVGSNTLTVTVTAEDTTTTKTYTITVMRAANTPGVTVSTTALTVTEADMTGDTYTMVLNIQPTANVTVTVAGHAGTDVTPTPASLTFTTSNWTTAQTVTVTAGDDANRANETVLLTHDAASIDANYHDITISSVTVTVDDNDAGVLVSNLEQSTGGHGDLLDFDQAQAFTTGSNSAGYTLTSIEIAMFWSATPDASFTVSIHSDNSGAPGASLGMLTHPSSLVNNAVNAFTHDGIDLDATTTYFVVVDSTGASGGSIRNAGSAAEDLTSAAGWSIGDSSLYRNRTSSGGWTTSQESKKIRINGTVNAGATIGGVGGSSGPTQTVPGAPTNLMAVATDGQVTLTWDAPEDDGGSAITDYEYRINGTGNWMSTGSTETTYTVTGLDNDTEYTFEVRAVNRIGSSQAPPEPAAVTPRAAMALDFTHFTNGGLITSDLVLVNAGAAPTQPTLYFYDPEGHLMDPEAVVDITGDLMVSEDGALTVQTAMAPLGVLTISTHGRGEMVSGSVKVVADGPIGGVLRFDIPGLGVAGVGASPPVRDVLFPARRQAGGINTAAALHNLEAEAMGVSCSLMSGGVALEAVEIPLAANGQTSWFFDDTFTTTDTSDFAGAVRCTAPGAGRFTAIAVEIDAAASIFTTLPVVEVNRGRAEAATLDFTHFANGTWITDLVFVNLETRQSGPALTPFHQAIPPTRPAIYFYDTAGNPIAADSLVDITGDLEIAEDGALTVRTEMAPLGVLTISTHGRGELLMGSVRVISEGPIGGLVRFDHPALGVAGVGASTPVGDAIVPVRRQEGGITTGVAIHNLESSPELVRCELRQAGVLLDAVSIPLEANGQTAWFIDQTFPGTDTSDFSGSVRCSATGEGLFTAVALEMDAANRIFTTLPVVPVVEAP